MYKVLGLSKKAIKYIQNNSKFVEGSYIGCKNSTGVINTSQTSYDMRNVDETTVIILYKHTLADNTACYEEIQCITNYNIVLQLILPDNTCIKWEDEELQALNTK